MLKIILCFGILFYVLPANAQIAHISAKPATATRQTGNQNLQQQQNAASSIKNQQAPVNNKNEVKEEKEPRSSNYIRDYGYQRDARNVRIVAEVATYKLGDERLAEEVDNLKNNKEFRKKFQKIMENLDNSKYPNSKNRQVMNILNEAGNKLYNLLAN